MEIEDAINTALLTLKEGFEGKFYYKFQKRLNDIYKYRSWSYKRK